MNTLFEKAFEAYKQMLIVHINTKTMERDFHEVTEAFYETLFNAAHLIGEKHVDLGGQLSDRDLDAEKALAYKTIEEFKTELESFVAESDLSLGTDDMLGSLANDLESDLGTAKSYLK